MIEIAKSVEHSKPSRLLLILAPIVCSLECTRRSISRELMHLCLYTENQGVITPVAALISLVLCVTDIVVIPILQIPGMPLLTNTYIHSGLNTVPVGSTIACV